MAESIGGPLDQRPNRTERPISDLLTDLWQDTEALVRQEIKLASTELESKAALLKADLTKAAIGGAALYAGLLTLIAALVLFVAKFVAPWLAALAVGAVLVALGYALLQKGKHLSAAKLKPNRTVQNVREDVRTFREAFK